MEMQYILYSGEEFGQLWNREYLQRKGYLGGPMAITEERFYQLRMLLLSLQNYFWMDISLSVRYGQNIGAHIVADQTDHM